MLADCQGSIWDRLKAILKPIREAGKQLFKREKTRINTYDESVAYAVPAHDGVGYYIRGYGGLGKPAYDNNVDIEQHSTYMQVHNYFGRGP